MQHTFSRQPLIKKLSQPITLFWRLFLSMLAILLLTSVLSIAIERWINTQELNSRMQYRIEHLVSDRQRIVSALQNDDLNQIRALYRGNKELVTQVRILDEQGRVIFPKFGRLREERNPLNDDHHLASPSRSPHSFESAKPPLPQEALKQISVDELNYPELTDITVTSEMGNRYTIQLQPRIPMRDLLSLRKDHTFIRFSLILVFSILVCYWLSQALTRRIKRVQKTVHLISDGQFKAGEALADLGNDELGMLAKDVAKLSTRLAESELARKQMLSDISHELRSPLARLDVATELTRDFAPNAGHYLDRIQKESTRMNELIEQIIRIQSLQMRQYSLNIESYQAINLYQLLDDIRQDVCFEFQDKGVTWQWQTDNVNAENITLLGDEQQLHSAFENIIRNAFSHTQPNTAVIVAIKPITQPKNQQDLVQIQIIDSGSGVAEEDLERIFQPFVRLSRSRERIVTPSSLAHSKKTHSKGIQSKEVPSSQGSPAAPKYEGYGLGLAIAHAIIGAHQGQLRAYNRTDGLSGLIVETTLPQRTWADKN